METANNAEQETIVFNAEELSTEIELDGAILYLNTDWRDIRHIIKLLNSTEYPQSTIAEACLKIFIDNFEDIIYKQNAIAILFDFISIGEKQNNDKPMPKEFDWEIDFSAIISDMNKISKCEDIRALPYMHWFTFVSIFNSIDEGNTSYRIKIRRKIRNHEKLTKDEKEWVSRNPDKAYLNQSLVSKEEKEKLKKRFG